MTQNRCDGSGLKLDAWQRQFHCPGCDACCPKKNKNICPQCGYERTDAYHVCHPDSKETRCERCGKERCEDINNWQPNKCHAPHGTCTEDLSEPEGSEADKIVAHYIGPVLDKNGVFKRLAFKPSANVEEMIKEITLALTTAKAQAHQSGYEAGVRASRDEAYDHICTGKFRGCDCKSAIVSDISALIGKGKEG